MEKFALFKAEIINTFIAEHGVQSVIEFGCGDGNQLTLARYPIYIGFDVSETAINKCKEIFAADPTKTFDVMFRYSGQKGDLTSFIIWSKITFSNTTCEPCSVRLRAM